MKNCLKYKPNLKQIEHNLHNLAATYLIQIASERGEVEIVLHQVKNIKTFCALPWWDTRHHSGMDRMMSDQCTAFQ